MWLFYELWEAFRCKLRKRRVGGAEKQAFAACFTCYYCCTVRNSHCGANCFLPLYAVMGIIMRLITMKEWLWWAENVLSRPLKGSAEGSGWNKSWNFKLSKAPCVTLLFFQWYRMLHQNNREVLHGEPFADTLICMQIWNKWRRSLSLSGEGWSEQTTLVKDWGLENRSKRLNVCIYLKSW